MGLFEMKPIDERIYNEEIAGFLPDEIIDIHTHIWLEGLAAWPAESAEKRSVSWPGLVAKDNSAEDLIETYRLMFPGKKVTPLVFGNVPHLSGLPALNGYVRESAARHGFPALFFSHPQMAPDALERELLEGGYAGVKSYLSFAPPYIPEAEIRCFDFFPPGQLEVINKLKKIVMLHIPRHGRLRDRVNLEQILEIKRNFPGVLLIIAHVGRAYCDGDVGGAFGALAAAGDLLFDISANCNRNVFEELIRAVGPERILFGSDMPILRMRTRRICEGDRYINLVPPGLYGDVSRDAHLREVTAGEAESVTFFMYEEILAFKNAAAACGLGRSDIQKVFRDNAAAVLKAAL